MKRNKDKKYIIQQLLRLFAVTLLLSAVAVTIMALINYFTRKTNVVEFSSVISGAAVSATIFYLAEQISLSIKQEKINRSYNFIERFNQPEFNSIMGEVIRFCRDHSKSDDEKLLILEAKKRGVNMLQYGRVAIVFNFFEEMSLAYNNNDVDRELMRNFFSDISMVLHNKGNFIILHKRRVNENPNFCAEWDKMNSLWTASQFHEIKKDHKDASVYS